MYEDYYRFSAKPFQLNPDPRFFYGSKGHKRAMAYLD
ncbi:MAG TPA: ATPase, partial [Thiobacillus sp.]|nr:ATPase [Thiobacillus sp.]